jgi:hypothetical protein
MGESPSESFRDALKARARNEAAFISICVSGFRPPLSRRPGPRSHSPGTTTAHANTSSPSPPARGQAQRGPIRRSNIEKLRSMDPGPRSRSPGTTTAHANTSSPSPPARGQAPAGTHTPQQYRETAEYGSRASLTLARDDSTSTRRPHPRRSLSSGRASGPVGEDRLQRGPIRRSNIEKRGVWIPGLARARPGRQRHHGVIVRLTPRAWCGWRE